MHQNNIVYVTAGYAARVRAVNAAGPGPWSLDSEKLVARHKALKPKMRFPDLGEERELVVKEGEKMRIIVQVEGEPPPEEVSWFLVGLPLQGGDSNRATWFGWFKFGMFHHPAWMSTHR